MSNLGSKPAFPRPVGHAEMRYRSAQPYYNEDQEGMTTRTYLAGEAMKGLLADHKDVPEDEWPKGAVSCPDAVAMLAIEHADALIARLEKKP